METATHSSNDIPAPTSPKLFANAQKVPIDEVPAAVVDREMGFDDMSHDEQLAYKQQQQLRGSRGSSRNGSFSGGKVVPGEWRHRVIEERPADADEPHGKFAKLRGTIAGEDVRSMKDHEKRAYAASKLGVVDEDKLSKASLIHARMYDDGAFPPSPPAITEDTPDQWYEEHRRQLKEERLSKELARQSTLSREQTEKNDSFGFRLKKAFSDAGAGIGKTANSAKKGTENKTRDSCEMQAHQRLAKYFPHLEKERLICAFDAEVVHDDRPIAGHVILTSGSVCFIGKGYNKMSADGGADEDAMFESALHSPHMLSDSRRRSLGAASDVTSTKSAGSAAGTKQHQGFSLFHKSHQQDGGKKAVKEPLLIAQCIPLCDILSYAPGIVVKCNDKHKTFIGDVPTDEMVPNALQLFAKDGHVYQFRHFHSRYMKTKGSAGRLGDGHDASFYDRFVNFFDHAWRAMGNGHDARAANKILGGGGL